MRVALFHFRAYETDGVSLEMDKWVKALALKGHETVMVAGNEGEQKIPLMEFRHHEVEKFFDQCFKQKTWSDNELIMEFERLTGELKKSISKFLDSFEPDLVSVNNIFSLPLNIPLARAIHELIPEYDSTRFVGHHHDFYWERDIYSCTCDIVMEWVAQYYPSPNLSAHFVINSLAMQQMKKRKGFESTVIDNYFDFSAGHFEAAAPANELRQKVGLADTDIFALHATRIVRRKGIEFAIQACAEMNRLLPGFSGNEMADGRKISSETEVKLVFPGMVEEQSYADMIKDMADEAGVKTIFCNQICSHTREKEKYPLWDFYPACDIVTYTSLLEGWGNQLIEALAARKPVIFYEYPVFGSDLHKFGFNLFSLGNRFKETEKGKRVDQDRVDNVAERAIEALMNRDNLVQITEDNFRIAREKLSIPALSDKLSSLLQI